MIKHTKTLSAAAIFGSIVAGAGGAFAQDSVFSLELNNATEIEGGCRLTYVAANNTDIALTQTAYEVAIFDAAGRVSNLLVLEFGELPQGKTRVVQFDLGNQACADISRIIVNNIAECSSSQGSHDVCMSGLATSSRTNVEFGL